MTTVKTLNVGIMPHKQFQARTIAIANGELTPSPDDPKVWFHSVESFPKVLSDGNRMLLALIAETEPESLTELAATSGREKSDPSRTLKTLEQYDLIQLEQGHNRQMATRANYSGVSLEMSFA
ncbi:transcriptional regulator [Paraburkholderia sp. JHI869]|uniref:HVO_A0114 family putative DNA-binding protein n=1 Tax=Paraburkholderia sp. JHI869 TaxID=3112959 RepID=UPI00316FAFC1